MLAAIGFFVWQAVGGGGTPTSPRTTTITVTPTKTTSTTSIPTTSTSSTTSTTAQTVNVDLGAYLGRPATEVVPELKALPVRVRMQDFITPDYAPGTVVNIEPSGQIGRGNTVLVSIAVAPPPTSTTPGPTG